MQELGRSIDLPYTTASGNSLVFVKRVVGYIVLVGRQTGDLSTTGFLEIRLKSATRVPRTERRVSAVPWSGHLRWILGPRAA